MQECSGYRAGSGIFPVSPANSWCTFSRPWHKNSSYNCQFCYSDSNSSLRLQGRKGTSGRSSCHPFLSSVAIPTRAMRLCYAVPIYIYIAPAQNELASMLARARPRGSITNNHILNVRAGTTLYVLHVFLQSLQCASSCGYIQQPLWHSISAASRVYTYARIAILRRYTATAGGAPTFQVLTCLTCYDGNVEGYAFHALHISSSITSSIKCYSVSLY